MPVVTFCIVAILDAETRFKRIDRTCREVLKRSPDFDFIYSIENLLKIELKVNVLENNMLF